MEEGETKDYRKLQELYRDASRAAGEIVSHWNGIQTQTRLHQEARLALRDAQRKIIAWYGFDGVEDAWIGAGWCAPTDEARRGLQ